MGMLLTEYVLQIWISLGQLDLQVPKILFAMMYNYQSKFSSPSKNKNTIG